MKGKYSGWTRGEEEALLNKHGGEERARAFLRGEFKLVPHGLSDLFRPLGGPIVRTAVSRFVAEDAFTKANGIAQMRNNFRMFILPVVEENVPEMIVQISELTCATSVPVAAVELQVHERGELALAHFLQTLQGLTEGCGEIVVAAYIGAGDETWAVNGCRYSDGWHVGGCRLGDHRTWNAGVRFISR